MNGIPLLTVGLDFLTTQTDFLTSPVVDFEALVLAAGDFSLFEIINFIVTFDASRTDRNDSFYRLSGRADQILFTPVSDGDPVPLPGAVWLMAAGLGGLGGWRAQRRARAA